MSVSPDTWYLSCQDENGLIGIWIFFNLNSSPCIEVLLSDIKLLPTDLFVKGCQNKSNIIFFGKTRKLIMYVTNIEAATSDRCGHLREIN